MVAYVPMYQYTNVLIPNKCNQSAEAAIRQIQDRGYAEKYKGSDQEVTLIGINFSTQKRNLEDWQD